MQRLGSTTKMALAEQCIDFNFWTRTEILRVE